MTKTPKTTKRTKADEPITEPEARAAYIAMTGKRSAARLHETFIKEGRETPSLRTFGKWRAEHQWVRLAKEHDEKIATDVADEIAKDATAQGITRARQFDTLASNSLAMAIDGLAKIDAAALKATDIRALAEVSERAAKMFELLEGRATERGDNLTRSKMDALLEEMARELEESLSKIPTIH